MRRVLPPVLLLALVALAGAAPGLATPLAPERADDAGSGGDAGDEPASALPVAAGVRHRGNLTPGLDAADHYALAWPGPSVVRVSVEADAPVHVTLRDPEGAQRRAFAAGPADAFASTVGDPAGAWVLAVELPKDASPRRTSYAFLLEFEPHDHARTVRVPTSDAIALAARFPTGSYARLELDAIDAHDLGRSAQAAAYVKHLRVAYPGGNVAVADEVAYGAGLDDALVEAEGVLPASVRLGTPATGVGGLGRAVHSLVAEEAGAGLSLAYGHAFHGGGVAVVRTAWDGPAFDVDLPGGSVAGFHALSDFSAGGGASVVAGPFGAAQGVGLDASLAPCATHVLFADARSPPGASSPTRMRGLQDGDLVLDLRDAAILRGSTRPLAGGWTFLLDHVDGIEQGTLRVIRASFALPPPGWGIAENPPRRARGWAGWARGPFSPISSDNFPRPRDSCIFIRFPARRGPRARDHRVPRPSAADASDPAPA